jgi:ATP synthase protein I
MTTETLHHTRISGARVLVGAAAGALVVTVAVVVAGAIAGGAPAAYGALVGALLVLVVFGLGAFAVNAVATWMPAASMLVALLTYTLQVLVLGLVFWALRGSGALGSTLDARWLAAAVIAGTLAWLTVQVVQATRQRIPVYELAVSAHTGGEG